MSMTIRKLPRQVDHSKVEILALASASVHAMDVQTGELEDGTLLLSTWSFDGNKLRKIRKK